MSFIDPGRARSTEQRELASSCPRPSCIAVDAGVVARTQARAADENRENESIALLRFCIPKPPVYETCMVRDFVIASPTVRRKYGRETRGRD